MNGPSPFAVDWLATYHGTTVAFMDFGKSAGTANFWISTDHLQTWEELLKVRWDSRGSIPLPARY